MIGENLLPSKELGANGKQLIADTWKFIDKKALARANWSVVRPALEEAVKDNDSNWDDQLLMAVELCVENFLLK